MTLALTGLTKRFGDVAAVRDLTLEVRDGELLTVLGPSGCGKTTTLRLIAGLETPEAGDIALDGVSILDRPPSRRSVAMVFQSGGLYPHMTVMENLAFGPRARGVSRAGSLRRAELVVASMGLGGLLERRPAELSGGEARRVALARAMVREPAVFLLDEPLGALDARAREELLDEIARVQERLATAMIYVTHDQHEALGLGHRVAVMNAGAVEQVGTPRAIYERPATVFCASFVGIPPMALGEASVSDGVIRCGNARAPAPAREVPARVTMGVRPEHVYIGGSAWAAAAPPGERFPAIVQRVEAHGDRSIITLDAAGITLRARCEPGFTLPSGDTVQAWLDPGGLHLFGPDGVRLGS